MVLMNHVGAVDAHNSGSRKHPGSVSEVFWVFLRLGVTSFGGPTAHLGYFRAEFVERRKWLDDRAYADLVALCQFLPGPASSQVGMALGLQRAGYAGLIAAWAAFTLPSALLLIAFAFGLASLGDLADAGWILGLNAAAVAVVAHAVFGMAKSLTPDAKRAAVALASLALVLLVPGIFAQIIAIAAAGVIGLLWLRPAPAPAVPGQTTRIAEFAVRVPKAVGAACLAAFVLLLTAALTVLPIIAQTTGNLGLNLFTVFARAGSLVFGGGHVVLPLLEAETVQAGLVSESAFLAGYGAAQAVPGPLFTFAAYLGALGEHPGNVATGISLGGAAIALFAIFLPAALLVIGALPFWQSIRRAPLAQRALAGVNAGVVGLLAAALYTPVFTAGVTTPLTLVFAATAFVALQIWKMPAWLVVLLAAAAGWLLL